MSHSFIIFIDWETDNEVILVKHIQVHRVNVRKELVELFSDAEILKYELSLTVIDPRGEEELGVGEGVVRDIICLFFNELKDSHMIGSQEKVPVVRHDMSSEQWKAVARILIYGIRVGYYPLFLSEMFMAACCFGEDVVSEHLLINAFERYVSIEEKNLIKENLITFDDQDEMIMDMLSSYNCYRGATSSETLKEIVKEVSHQEIIQKPRYISNCFSEIFRLKKKDQPFSSLEDLKKFYTSKTPSGMKLNKILIVSKTATGVQLRVLGYLKQFIKSLDQKDILLFLRFVTGGDLLPEQIDVEFSSGVVPIMPRVRTCIPSLQLPEEYTCYNELGQDFSNILKSTDSFLFHLV